MNVSVWDYDDYKSFIKAWILAKPHRGHGAKAAMARAANCQTAYISQVVLAQAQLSLEQAEKIADFFEFLEDEKHYFLTLVQMGRAGTETLRQYFSKQLKAQQEKREQLKNRLEVKTDLTPEAQAIYFSSWIYPAVHLLVRVPGYSTRDKIASRLGLTHGTIEECLHFLESVGLLSRSGTKYVAGSTTMHLPHDSPLISKHHINWRLRAIRDLEIRNDKSLHYSSCVSISQKDGKRIREQLLQMIESAKATIKESADESLYSFCLDFFEL
jgi:uncharacterized protein (TIGR02147 family)